MTRPTSVFLFVALLSSALGLAAVGVDSPEPNRFSGSTVLAKYVAGSKPDLLGKLGCLDTPDSDSLVFKSYEKQSWLRRLFGSWVHLMDPSWRKGTGQCRTGGSKALVIDYGKIRVLARGQVQSMGQSSAGPLQAMTTIGGISGVVTALTSLNGETKIALLAGAGTVVIVGAGAYLNRRTNNYITIFYGECKEPQATIQTETTKQVTCESSDRPDKKTVTEATKETQTPSGELFRKCTDFAVFQIIDPHDYWNTSMLLNAKTGLTFVGESAQKSAPSK
jgi:hypothetical protein